MHWYTRLMQPTDDYKLKSPSWTRILNGLVILMALVVLLFVISTYFDSSSPDYHQVGAIFGTLILLSLIAFLLFYGDRLHQWVELKGTILTYTKGRLWKASGSVDLSHITKVEGFSLSGQYGKVNWGLYITDSSGTTLTLLLNYFTAKKRRRIVETLQPILQNPNIPKLNDVNKTISYWTDTPLEAIEKLVS